LGDSLLPVDWITIHELKELFIVMSKFRSQISVGSANSPDVNKIAHVRLYPKRLTIDKYMVFQDKVALIQFLHDKIISIQS